MSTAERTAERPSFLCEAYGCPMVGTRSASTSGGGFMCNVHFGLDAGQIQSATVEVNRLAWLSHAVRDIRTRSHNPAWRDTYARIKQDIAMAQRADLQFKATESTTTWMIRLEAELASLVKAAIEPAHDQQPLEV